MAKGLLKLYGADIVWKDSGVSTYSSASVIIAVPDRRYETIPDWLDERVFYYLDVDVQPVAPEDLGDCVVVAFSEDYEEVWFDVETNDEWGECDNCGKQYELASREGRCGDCGNCSNCCDHFLKEEN